MNIFGLCLQESENCKAEILKLELEDLEILQIVQCKSWSQ